jgi:acyl CoA:acetate/3-ketoacid CoA transferase beta subunit
MTFMIGPRKLIEMIELTEVIDMPDPGVNDLPHTRRTVCLQASRGTLAVECSGQRSEEKVVVWTEGQCRIAITELLTFLRQFQLESAVTMDVSCGMLRIRHLAVRVLGACAWTATSDVGQCDFATD